MAGLGIKFMNLLNVGFYLFGALVVVALGFLVVNWTRYVRRKSKRIDQPGSSQRFPLKSTLAFIIVVLLTITIAEIISSVSRTESLNFLAGLSGNYIVYVNQRPISDSATVISVLKAMSPAIPHHSHPTNRIQVDIQTDKVNLRLELRRDSDNPQEYWVFYPKYTVTSNNEIGRINTAAFDAY